MLGSTPITHPGRVDDNEGFGRFADRPELAIRGWNDSDRGANYGRGDSLGVPRPFIC